LHASRLPYQSTCKQYPVTLADVGQLMPLSALTFSSSEIVSVPAAMPILAMANMSQVL
jgi:hypothetical protein